MAGREEAMEGLEAGQEEEAEGLEAGQEEEAEGSEGSEEKLVFVLDPWFRSRDSLCISAFDTGNAVPFRLHELEAHLQEEQFLGVTNLTFFVCTGPNDLRDPAYMEAVGSAIRNSHPNLKALILHQCLYEYDATLAAFLENMPPQLSLIILDLLTQELPQTFQALRRFRQLETIKIHDGEDLDSKWCSPQSFENLADSLENMPLLRRVEIATDRFVHPKRCLEPLFTVLGAKENKVEVQINTNDYYHGLETRAIPHTIDQELWDILEHGPTLVQRLKQAHRRGCFPEDMQYDGNLQAWVEAMTFFNDAECNEGEDAFDVFHFLVAQLPPLLLTSCLTKTSFLASERAHSETLGVETADKKQQSQS